MSRFDNFKKKTEWFIETGSLFGDGIQLALNSGFDKVFSIELFQELYDSCVKRFDGNDKVVLKFGDSSKVLPEILKEFPDRPFTYWLDGHYSGEGTALGDKESPLLEELEAILSRGVSGELIYIDDMRIYRDFNEELNVSSITELLKKYKPDGFVHYEASNWDAQDILVIEY